MNIHYLNIGYAQEKVGKKTVGRDTEIIPPVHFDPDVIIGANCTIGPNVYLERGCKIGEGVKLEYVVVLRGRKIPNYTETKNQVIW